MAQQTKTVEIEIDDNEIELIFDWVADSIAENGLLIPNDLSDYGDHLELLEKATLDFISTDENIQVFRGRVGHKTKKPTDSEVFIAEEVRVNEQGEEYATRVLRATEEWAHDVEVELRNVAFEEITTAEVPV